MADRGRASRRPRLNYPAAPTRRAGPQPRRRLVIPVAPYGEDVVLLIPGWPLEPEEWARLMDVLCAMRPGLVSEPTEDQDDNDIGGIGS